MPTATRKRRRAKPRRTKATAAPHTKDTYHVIGPDGSEIPTREVTQTYSAFALGHAQKLALDVFTEPVALIVQRRSLFGPPADIYRVTRDEDKGVTTTTLALED